MLEEDHARRLAWIGGVALGLVVTAEFAAALSFGFAGDDFELFALARIGGFHPAALFVPHRTLFVKPVLNAAWASFAWVFGARPALWYGLGLAVHLVNTALLGLLASRLCAQWSGALANPHDCPLRRPDRRAVLTGLAAAGVWAVHDRLAEPLFSLSSLNHSLTFTVYLLSLLACLRALRTGAARDRLLLSLACISALFCYEVAASLIPAAAALALLDGRGSLRERAVRVGVPVAGSALVFAAVQGLARTTPGSTSYYHFSPQIALRSFSEIGLSFLHMRSSWIAPGPVPAVVLGTAAAVLFFVVRDRLVRFGLLWSAASYLPLAAIPEFSDRYHYIAFAGLALAAGRGFALALGRGAARAARTSALAAATLMVVHLAWSLGGATEQAAYYRFKSRLPGQILGEVSAALSRPRPAEEVIVLAWADDPGFNARRLARFESEGMTHRLGEISHPIYVRPDAILGAVYPGDLMTIAAARWNEFYRVPQPGEVARALVEARAHIIPVALATSEGRTDVLAVRLGARLRETLIDRREIPVALPAETDVSSVPLRFAYFARTDRRGAFEEEYGASAKPGSQVREPRVPQRGAHLQAPASRPGPR